MNLPHNIDYFRHARKYVGYGAGVWTVSKSSSSYGRWVAIKKENPNRQVYGWNLDQLGERIEQATETAGAL